MWKRKAEHINSNLGTLPVLTEIFQVFWLTASSTSYLPPCLDHWTKPQLQNYSYSTLRIAERMNHSIAVYYHSTLLSLSHLHRRSLLSGTSHTSVQCSKICSKQCYKSCLQGEKALSRMSTRSLDICKLNYCKIENKNTDLLVSIDECLPVHYTLLIYTSYTHKLYVVPSPAPLTCGER